MHSMCWKTVLMLRRLRRLVRRERLILSLFEIKRI
jgi:hypothetical protein